MIKFEEVGNKFKQSDDETILPIRGDKGSAGYDFFAKEDFVIKGSEVRTLTEITGNPNLYGSTIVFSKHLFWTDVKIQLPEDKVLFIDIRSGMGSKHDLMITNTIGVIDSSYYGNESNDGNIGISIKNLGIKDYEVKKGDRIAQGIILDYYVTDDDKTADKERTGGFGNSGK